MNKALAAIAAIAVAGSVRAAGDEKKVDFAKDVQPILKASCLKCHSLDPKKPKKKGAGELRLDDQALAMKGGRSGTAIKPGDAQHSLLFQLLKGPVPRPVPDEDDKDIAPMPHAKRGQKWKPLKPEEVETIRRWIDQGAQWSQ